MTLSIVDVYVGNGAPASANWASSSPPDGVLYLDELNGRLYTFKNGAWADAVFGGGLVFNRVAASVSAGSDLNTNVCVVPWAGTVSAVSYISVSSITGADTDTRTISIVDKGAAGSGTTTVATLALVSGVGTTADVPKALTLGDAAHVAVAAGDVLQFKSVHSGNGLADPGGTVVLTLARS